MIGLIGHTGFVGGHLNKQFKIDKHFNSKNINDLNKYEYEILFCAGMSGVKWKANKFPEQDDKNLEEIIKNISTVYTKKFILLSTVDVFTNPNFVDEDSKILLDNDNHYGMNRYRLEKFVAQNFKSHLICRLTGLVGQNLKKNFLYDVKHNNELNKFNPNSSFQFYPIARLWKDIQTSLHADIKTIHLNAEPVSVLEIAKYLNIDLSQFSKANKKYSYNMTTKYSNKFKKSGNYLYSKSYILNQIQDYIDS